MHFTPTSGSWLNMVEIFFGIITRQAIRRGTFTSVKDLIAAIGRFIDGWNDRCQPFTWTKTADEIIPNATGGKRTSFTRHATGASARQTTDSCTMPQTHLRNAGLIRTCSDKPSARPPLPALPVVST